MLKRALILFTGAALSLTSACERTVAIDKNALLERTRHWKEPKVAIWYYTGSRDGRDYFRYHDLGISEVYSVRSGEIVLLGTFPQTDDRSKWIVMPWGPAAKPNI
jgi:basic membrane lipoprotein Med (substrate-binding protein (PBP1-ABC) superfamily)